MKLYRGPHTCAIGTHILLEEIGKPYATKEIDVAGGAMHEPSFKDILPKGKVPALERDDGSVLTEYGAIAVWLARTNPEAGLLPSDAEAEARTLEIMDYVVGTVHAQGFGRLFLTERYEPQDMLHGTFKLGQGKVRRQGREIIEQGFGLLDRQLAGRPYATGDAFSVADTALFYVERWAPQVDIPLPPNLAGHFERMTRRPAVARVRKIWGEA